MSLKLKMTESGPTHEADEWYSGMLTRVEEGDDYGYGPTVRLIIELDDEQSETWAMASQTLSPRSKLYSWVKGIDPGLLPEPGGILDLSDLEDRRVDVMFETTQKDDGTERERVVKIRASKSKPPVKVMQKRAATAKRAVAASDDEEDAPF